MKTFISNKQQSESGYESKLLERIDRKSSKDYKDPEGEGPFNDQMAEQLKALFKDTQPKTGWNTLTIMEE